MKTPPISNMASTWTDVLYARGTRNGALRASARRIFVDDVEQQVTVEGAEQAVAVIRQHLMASDFGSHVRLGLLPLLDEHIIHKDPPEGRKYGLDLGAALQPLIYMGKDPNGSIERAILRLFQAQDLYEFLHGLRRLLERTKATLYLDLDLLEKRLTSRFRYDDPNVITTWTLSFYRMTPASNTTTTDTATPAQES